MQKTKFREYSLALWEKKSCSHLSWDFSQRDLRATILNAHNFFQKMDQIQRHFRSL